MDTLYRQIAAARKRAGLTQAELSEKIGIAQGDISNIERGKVDPRLSTLIRIAMVLNLDLFAVPRAYKNKVINLIRDESEPIEDISLLQKYGVPDDE